MPDQQQQQQFREASFALQPHHPNTQKMPKRTNVNVCWHGWLGFGNRVADVARKLQTVDKADTTTGNTAEVIRIILVRTRYVSICPSALFVHDVQIVQDCRPRQRRRRFTNHLMMMLGTNFRRQTSTNAAVSIHIARKSPKCTTRKCDVSIRRAISPAGGWQRVKYNLQ